MPTAASPSRTRATCSLWIPDEVLSKISAEVRSGCAIANRSAARPPIEYPKIAHLSMPSASRTFARSCANLSSEYLDGSSGAEDCPWPGRSTAMTRYCDSSEDRKFVQVSADPVKPWRKTIGLPSPLETMLSVRESPASNCVFSASARRAPSRPR